jgi:hypothetical protein
MYIARYSGHGHSRRRALHMIASAGGTVLAETSRHHGWGVNSYTTGTIWCLSPAAPSPNRDLRSAAAAFGVGSREGLEFNVASPAEEAAYLRAMPVAWDGNRKAFWPWLPPAIAEYFGFAPHPDWGWIEREVIPALRGAAAG